MEGDTVFMSSRGTHGATLKLRVVILGMLVWAGLPFAFPPGFVAPTAHGRECSSEEFPGSLEQILDNPEVFIGCKVFIQGTLERDLDEDNLTVYFIRVDSGRTLEVRPWGPLDEAPSNGLERRAINVSPMSSFSGKRLFVVGHLVQEPTGRIRLEASMIQELQEFAP